MPNRRDAAFPTRTRLTVTGFYGEALSPGNILEVVATAEGRKSRARARHRTGLPTSAYFCPKKETMAPAIALALRVRHSSEVRSFSSWPFDR